MPGAFDHLYEDGDRFDELNAVTELDQTPASLGEIRSASFGIIDREGKSNSAINAYSPFLDARADLYEELTGQDGDFMRLTHGLQESNKLRVRGYMNAGELTVNEAGQIQANSKRAGARFKTDERLIRSMFETDRMSKLHPGTFLSDSEIDRAVAEDLRVKREADLKILARSKGAGGTLATLAGAAGGALTDPLILTTLPLGMGTITGPSVAANLGKAFLSEAAIAAIIEVPIQAEVFRFKDRIDSPYTYKEAAFNVLAASLGAGALRGTGSVTIDLATKAVNKFKASRAARAPTPEQERAIDELETYVRDAEQNPVGAENEAAHIDALDQAAADLEAGRVPDVEELVGDLPPAQVDPDVPGGRVYRAEDVETFDPRELEIDAESFQFKTGGDDEGVTRAFKDIDEFRIERAGQVIVYETADGRRFIVDGHQRMGIARRAIEAGQDPDTVKLFGVILREADGVTRGEARATAAFKNIAEGTGTGIDAAKVMRELGEEGLSMMPALPRAGVIASRGQSLSRLGDDSFMAVVNEIVPEDQAAIVGELIADNVLQKAAIDTLARVQPGTQVQAREVIKQVREAGATIRETNDLFGDQVVETLVLERAKVVDDALRILRTETKTFKTLVQKQEAIEGAGDNVLDKATNEQQVLDNAKASEILQREAHTKGPVSEAVQRAAERLKAGDSRKSVTEAFLGDLQAAVNRRDGAGLEPGAARAEESAELVQPAPGTPTRTLGFSRADRKRVEAEFLKDQEPWDFDQIYANSESSQAALIGALDELSEALGGIKIKNPGLKLRETSEAKMGINGYEVPGNITDIVRAGAIIDDPAVAVDFIAGMGERFAIIDEGLKMGPVGYADIKVLVKLESGQVGEVQIWSPKMLEVKTRKPDGGEALYKKIRELSFKDPETREMIPRPGNEAKVEALNEQSVDLYTREAISLSPKAWQKLYVKIANDDLKKVLADLEETGFQGPLQKLPENQDTFFTKPKGSREVSLDTLNPIRARPKGVQNANTAMAKTQDGGKKRVPLDVMDNGDGTFAILDGNSTYANAVNSGWKKIRVRVVQENSASDISSSAKKADRLIEKPLIKGSDTAIETQPRSAENTAAARSPEELRNDTAGRLVNSKNSTTESSGGADLSTGASSKGGDISSTSKTSVSENANDIKFELGSLADDLDTLNDFEKGIAAEPPARFGSNFEAVGEDTTPAMVADTRAEINTLIKDLQAKLDASPIEDLGGPVDRKGQELADATRAKDEARQGTRDVGVEEEDFFGQGGKLEADLFDEAGTLSVARREADLFSDEDAAAAIDEAVDILNDQDIEIPLELVDRAGDPEIISKGGRELFDELDDADQAIIDIAVCNRSAA